MVGSGSLVQLLLVFQESHSNSSKLKELILSVEAFKLAPGLGDSKVPKASLKS